MSNSKHNVPDTHSGFSESWLCLREPTDHAARDRGLTDQLSQWSKTKGSLKITELGAGTGSNLRYLIPLLGHEQHWQVLDNDATLIDRLPQLLTQWAATLGATLSKRNNQLSINHEHFNAIVSCNVVDLASELENVMEIDTDLITASALLDLTSEKWLDVLAELITNRRCACLFTLNYNGHIEWQPANEHDAIITALLNQHQLSNKGFGKAAGPEAGQYLAKVLERLGRKVSTAQSQWQIAPESKQLQHAIIEGWQSAAIEQSTDRSALIKQWYAIRTQAIDTRISSLTVEHVDVLSLR